MQIHCKSKFGNFVSFSSFNPKSRKNRTWLSVPGVGLPGTRGWKSGAPLLDEGFITPPKHLSAVAMPRAERSPAKRPAKARPATTSKPSGKLEYALREDPAPYRVSRTKKRL
jgi:hypothetical protein